MLGAARVQIPENNLDDLHSSREEDETSETMDPQNGLGSFLLADTDLRTLDLLIGNMHFLTYHNKSRSNSTMGKREEDSNFLAAKRYAIVTGSNKGIGLEVCKQLASKGVMVVLTARDVNKGIEAMKILKDYYIWRPENLVFHQLDVLDPSSISCLVDFVKTKYGKLDILVNNAGILGLSVDINALEASKNFENSGYIKWGKVSTQPYDLGEECITTNYYGAKRMAEAFMPLLSLSDSPRIVNVSSSSGKLE
ncbi:(+)-neomenthol dehydrogenase-like protein, partial [Tanacetum coccineum]